VTGGPLQDVSFREATATDLDTIVSMLSDDILGAARERFEIPGFRASHEGMKLRLSPADLEANEPQEE